MEAAAAQGAKDAHHITATGEVLADRIHGSAAKVVPNIITRNGVTTEVLREDWGVGASPIVHAIHVILRAGALSAWHKHMIQTDHIMVLGGSIKCVLYDGREDSPTFGKVDVHHLSPMRPTLVVVPPGVWHGLQNLEGHPSSFLNYFDYAYKYEDPDEWRLPADTDEIPYRF